MQLLPSRWLEDGPIERAPAPLRGRPWGAMMLGLLFCGTLAALLLASIR